MEVRAAEQVEINRLAELWHESWHDAHAQIVPAELTRLRTLESFRDRLQADLPNIRVVGPLGAPVGFCIVRGNELYQLFVSANARGMGVAAAFDCRRRGPVFGNGDRNCMACLLDRK